MGLMNYFIFSMLIFHIKPHTSYIDIFIILYYFNIYNNIIDFVYYNNNINNTNLGQIIINL